MTQAVPNRIGAGPVVDLGAAPDTTQRFPLGTVVFVDDAFFGGGEFIYGKSAAAMDPGRLTFPDFGWVMTDLPNTALLGYPIYVCRQVFSAASQFGWFQRSGSAPVQTAASVAAGVAVGIGAAGKAGTLAASKQIVNAVVQKASTYAPTQANCQTYSGSPRINLNGVSGLFKGLAVSGTGIPGGTTILSVDNENQITLSANATASGSVTLTFTWTNFLLLGIDRAFGQGAIT